MNARIPPVAALSAAIFLIATSPVLATVISVGPDAECTTPSVQVALDTAQVGDEIHVMRAEFSDQHLVIDDKDVTLIGGYTGCTDASSSGQYSGLQGGPGASVLRIGGSAHVTLANLYLHGASMDRPDSYGGGLDFEGQGSLGLEHVLVGGNRAAHGGGIAIRASGPTVATFASGTIVGGNHALLDGGGVFADGAAHLRMIGSEILISNNAAQGEAAADGGYGGGLLVKNGALVDMVPGASGNSGYILIAGNDARLGAGIAVLPGGTVRIASADSAATTVFGSNWAHESGGGVYLRPSASAPAMLCANSLLMQGNSARDGAAIYAAAEGGRAGQVYIGPGEAGQACAATPLPTETAICYGDAGSGCNHFDDNDTVGDHGDFTNGAVVSMQKLADLHIDSLSMRHNRAGSLLSAIQSDSTRSASLSACLLADNSLLDAVASVGTQGALRLSGCTVANNGIASSTVFSVDGTLTLNHDLLAQPGMALDDHQQGHVSGIGNMLSTSLTQEGLAQSVLSDDPRFVLPESGNYHLLPSSPAIDVIDAIDPAEDHDLDANPRGIALLRPTTPFDAGAFERQASVPVTFPDVENFDELDGDQLPQGWVSSAAGAAPVWTLSNQTVYNGSFAAYSGASTGGIGENRMTTPAFTVLRNGRLTFQHHVDLQEHYDVAVLEISIDHGPFVDILAAGGHFVSGGYDVVQWPGDGGNPVGEPGRLVWSGQRGATGGDWPLYDSVKVDLPASANGKSVQLSWRVGTDASVDSEGYHLDAIVVELDRELHDALYANNFEGAE